MTFHFNFRSVEKRKDVLDLCDFLIKQDLGYPQYDDWVQRAEHEVDSGYKTVVLAFSGNRLVGDVIYQPHKELARVREIKNIRVHPRVRGRNFGRFMVRQAEVEPPTYDAIIVDARIDQQDIVGLLRVEGYVPLVTVPLYDENMPDVVMIKSFDQRTAAGIAYATKKLILGDAEA